MDSCRRVSNDVVELVDVYNDVVHVHEPHCPKNTSRIVPRSSYKKETFSLLEHLSALPPSFDGCNFTNIPFNLPFVSGSSVCQVPNHAALLFSPSSVTQSLISRISDLLGRKVGRKSTKTAENVLPLVYGLQRRSLLGFRCPRCTSKGLEGVRNRTIQVFHTSSHYCVHD